MMNSLKKKKLNLKAMKNKKHTPIDKKIDEYLSKSVDENTT
jgi:hypothetical protein